ncbi:aldehyde ferredoxin oxidoreductase C-terminal domain-containing protein, partial [Candidatus Hakubella thermalkaliphila]
THFLYLYLYRRKWEKSQKDPLIGGRAQGKVLSEEDLETMLQTYYELRGWDKEGVPTQKKLSSLGLADL